MINVCTSMEHFAQCVEYAQIVEKANRGVDRRDYRVRWEGIRRIGGRGLDG